MDRLFHGRTGLTIQKIIDSQFEVNGLKSLFFEGNFQSNMKHAFTCSEYTREVFLNSLSVMMEPLDTAERDGHLQDLFRRIGDDLIRHLTTLNQFILIGKGCRKQLSDAYSLFYHRIKAAYLKDDIDETTLKELFMTHYRNIRDILVSVNGMAVFEEYKNAPLVNGKICEEYSALLQLQIMAIDGEELLTPVLDIGCGTSAYLVRYLRSRGIEAYGLDRNLVDHSFLISDDWMDFDFGDRRWGTIISHMAFSNHFWHCTRSETVDIYLRKFTDILKALQPGGSFIYAPGLPFLDEWVEESDHFILEALRTTAAVDERFYCTKIVRI